MTNYKPLSTREDCVCCHKQILFERNAVDKLVVIENTSYGSRTLLIASYVIHKRCAETRWIDFLDEHPEVREIGD